MKYLLTLTLLFIAADGRAGEMDDIKQLKQQQQRLQQLLDEVKKSEDQRDQQKAMLERMQQQMECNWTLIQSYETCEQLYQRASQELLDCTTKAKANSVSCLAPLRQ